MKRWAGIKWSIINIQMAYYREILYLLLYTFIFGRIHFHTHSPDNIKVHVCWAHLGAHCFKRRRKISEICKYLKYCFLQTQLSHNFEYKKYEYTYWIIIDIIVISCMWV